MTTTDFFSLSGLKFMIISHFKINAEALMNGHWICPEIDIPISKFVDF
jgi:hypothetical protein